MATLTPKYFRIRDTTNSWSRSPRTLTAKKEFGVELADVLGNPEPARRSGFHGRRCGGGHGATQDVLAGGVDPVEHQHEQGDEEQIAVPNTRRKVPGRLTGPVPGSETVSFWASSISVDLVLAGGGRYLGGGQVRWKMGLVPGALSGIHHIADQHAPE